MLRSFVAVLCLAVLVSCLGTTGYNLVQFYFAASGPADGSAARPFPVVYGDQTFTVTLTQATLHVGAVYLDQSVPTSGAGAEPCTLPGTYVGEVRGGGDVDMLSPNLQSFPGILGDGSTIPAQLGQVWLTHGDVNDDSDPLPVLTLAGTAQLISGSCGATPWPLGETRTFTAGITIDKNRNPAPAATSLPGESPICLQKIVTPILTQITLSQAGTLVLRVDPRALFNNASLCDLPETTKDPPTYGFTDDDKNQPSRNLFQNLKAAGAVYGFEFNP